ncbi:MAG: SRPBCC family protein [Nitrososphaerota archaeon]|nr:SRPBCC family protein [Nitrososphaerota archaeon]MDG6969375.1 SRPBCC family protein [Nitrososphaerota archaeon]MDG6972980.1 SRPBCC family protein [Nitrososphaerota archaeon]MDG7015252.1 SRPBCC family protein [Nitrososphaerota archaeon]WGO50008.1 MAG: SRPBCC family protein [Nitrososphaerota archaeon]
MASITESKVIDADIDRAWDIVSDVDRDPEYWSGLSSVRNIRRSGNTIERQATVGFIGREGKQTIRLHPKESLELIMTSGPLRGTRVLKLTRLSDGAKTTVAISWDFRFSGVPEFAQAFVKTQLERVTKDALKRIGEAAEGTRAITRGTRSGRAEME